jgi:transposase
MGGRGLATHKKSARRRSALIVFEDESGVSLTPVVRSTWAPPGETPVLHHRFAWKRSNMAVALCFSPDGTSADVVFHFQPTAYNDETLPFFLADLHELVGLETKVTLIWDGLPSHRSKAMQAYLREQRRWLTVERLPGYAPELNPVEGLWGNVKGTELANLCPDTIAEAMQAVDDGINRVANDTHLCFSLLAKSGLSL